MPSQHETEMREDVAEHFTELGEAITYTTAAGSAVSTTAIVQRHGIDREESETRSKAVYRATVSIKLADVPAPSEQKGEKVTMDLFEDGGSNPVDWSVESVGEIAGGVAVVEVEYTADREVRRDGHRQST